MSTEPATEAFSDSGLALHRNANHLPRNLARLFARPFGLAADDQGQRLAESSVPARLAAHVGKNDV